MLDPGNLKTVVNQIHVHEPITVIIMSRAFTVPNSIILSPKQNVIHIK